jgi:beta-aspartyl-peptidase (threonine type)
MERSPHVMLVGAGAEEFARTQGIELVSNEYFRTPIRQKQLHRLLQGEAEKENDLVAHALGGTGTVGAVALDARGNVAAATSTGGMTGKRWGRIGDSPVIGAGTYAADGNCAVSATGSGEYFIRTSAARQICDRMRWLEASAQVAADATIADIGGLGGDGGVIVMDARGHIAFAMNSSGMYRGWASAVAPAGTAIYSDE